jgi:hypothetical protein
VIVDRVTVAPPVSLPGDVSAGRQFRDDAMSGAFGDPEMLADVAETNAGIARDADQSLPVVREERPSG